MRRSLLLAPLLLLLSTARPLRGEDPAEPTSVADLAKALAEVQQRLERLLNLARTDPRLRLVAAYQAYGPADFVDKKREVQAEDLMKWMTDPDAPADLRKKAFEALTSREAMRHDPELKEDASGGRKPRQGFARDEVVKFVKDKDRQARIYASELLKAWFPPYKNDPDIVTYDPVGGNRASWTKAYNHWMKVLKR